ncbi:jun-like transcription factor, partial [Oleoguttula sp. CCFEE 5521]
DDDDDDEESETSSDSSSDESDTAVMPQKVDHIPTVKKLREKAKAVAKVEPEVASASSSATLAGASPEPVTQSSSAEVSSGESGMHPSRLARMDNTSAPNAAVLTAAAAAKIKKESNTPFSRIPANQAVDPKFASNQYVPYDYAEKAHQDLIVTRGKGFTKEKNKKKRGSYRGGAIDFAPKGIKFED